MGCGEGGWRVEGDMWNTVVRGEWVVFFVCSSSCVGWAALNLRDVRVACLHSGSCLNCHHSACTCTCTSKVGADELPHCDDLQ